MLTKCLFTQSFEGELLAIVNRDCYFDHTFHKTHVHSEPQKAHRLTKYIKRKISRPTYLSQKESWNHALPSTYNSKLYSLSLVISPDRVFMYESNTEIYANLAVTSLICHFRGRCFQIVYRSRNFMLPAQKQLKYLTT